MAEKKQSLALALLTSFLVVVVGAALWGVLYYYGVFSAWVAFLAVFCAGLCWQRFYKTNWVFFVWTAVWSIVLNIASMIFALIIALQIGFACSFSIAIEMFASAFSELKDAFILDCVLSIVFTAIGLLFAFLNYKFSKKKAQAKQSEVVQVAGSEQKAETNPLEKIGDFLVGRYAKIGEIENAEERETKLQELRDGYISKLDQASKEEIVKIVSGKTYSASQLVAVELLKEELK